MAGDAGTPIAAGDGPVAAGLCRAGRAAGRGRDGLTPASLGFHGTDGARQRRFTPNHARVTVMRRRFRGFREFVVRSSAICASRCRERDFSGKSHGNPVAMPYDPHILAEVRLATSSTFVLAISRSVILVSPCRHLDAVSLRSSSHKFPLLPMNSHGIPLSSKRWNGTKRGDQDPEPGEGRFHTGTRASSNDRDPARERADIPPGGARSWTPSDGTGRRIGQWQQPDPPFSFQGPGTRN